MVHYLYFIYAIVKSQGFAQRCLYFARFKYELNVENQFPLQIKKMLTLNGTKGMTESNMKTSHRHCLVVFEDISYLSIKVYLKFKLYDSANVCL